MIKLMHAALLMMAALFYLAIPKIGCSDEIGVVLSRSTDASYPDVVVFDDTGVKGSVLGISGALEDCVVTPSADVTLVANWSSSQVHVIDLTDPTNPSLDSSIDVGSSPNDLSLTPDGNIAIVCTVNGHSVDVIDVETMTLESSFSLGEGVEAETCSAVEVCDDGVSVLMAQYSEPYQVKRLVLNQSTMTLTDSGDSLPLTFTTKPLNLACAPGSQVGAVALQSNGVQSFTIPDMTFAGSRWNTQLQTVRISPDGDYLFTRDMGDYIKRYPFDSTNGSISLPDIAIPINIENNYVGVESFEIDNSGAVLIASNQSSDTVDSFDTSDGAAVGSPLAVTDNPYGICLSPVVMDSDGDGVVDSEDVCANTVIPETIPYDLLRFNRYALTDEDLDFDTVTPGGKIPETYTVSDTAGCSCEQIADELSLGLGQIKFGCSNSVMSYWIDLVN